MAEQPTMTDVLALHVIIDRKSRYSGAVWCSCGFRTEFTGHVYEQYRGHVAQELTTAGFGNQHDAWAEGVRAAIHSYGHIPREDIPIFHRNPYT